MVLRSLVSKEGFDPDCLCYGTVMYEPRNTDERDNAMRFPVWGSRLMDLWNEIENPTPRNSINSWLERKSKSRHVMLVAVVTLGAAVVLGILGVVVAALQLWIAWRGAPPGQDVKTS